MDKLNEYIIYQLWLSNKQETWDFLKPQKNQINCEKNFHKQNSNLSQLHQ